MIMTYVEDWDLQRIEGASQRTNNEWFPYYQGFSF